MSLQYIKLSNKEKKNYLESPFYFGDESHFPILIHKYADNKTNTSIVYTTHLQQRVTLQNAFLFYKNVPIKFQLLEEMDNESPTNDKRSPLFKYRLNIARLFLPLNFKLQIEEIKTVLSAYSVIIICGETKLFDDLMAKKSIPSPNYSIDFTGIIYVNPTWSLGESYDYILTAYGPNIKKNFTDRTLATRVEFIDGIRHENQLYTFRLVCHDLLVDFHALYHMVNDSEATYQITDVAIPEEFIPYVDFLIEIIPKSLLLFSEKYENLKTNIDFRTCTLNYGSPKQRLLGNVGPLTYPLNVP
jgi:hypothetical protein